MTYLPPTVFGGGGGGPDLTPTTEKTANYTAVAGDLVGYDPSGGTFTITLPASPSNGDVVGIKNNSEDETIITISQNGNDGEHPLTGEYISWPTTISFGGPEAARACVIFYWDNDSGVWRVR